MPLIKKKLELDIFAALEKNRKALKQSPVEANQKLAKGIANAVDKYIKLADVETVTDTPAIQIQPGQNLQTTTITYYGPQVSFGTTIAPGQLVPGTGIGKGKGKVV